MLRTGVSLLLALIVGSGVAAKWNDWILFTNRVDFGQKDAHVPHRHRLLRVPAAVPEVRARLAVLGADRRPAGHPRGPLPQRRHPGAGAGPAGVAAGEGARVGAARRPGAGPGRAVLARALRARVLDPGGGRRRHLHRRQRAGEGPLPADDHLDHRVRAVPRQHPPPGLGAAGHRGRALAVRDRAGRRDGAGARAALPGEAGRAVEGSDLHPPQHRRHARRAGPGRGRRRARSTSTASSTGPRWPTTRT